MFRIKRRLLQGDLAFVPLVAVPPSSRPLLRSGRVCLCPQEAKCILPPSQVSTVTVSAPGSLPERPSLILLCVICLCVPTSSPPSCPAGMLGPCPGFVPRAPAMDSPWHSVCLCSMNRMYVFYLVLPRYTYSVLGYSLSVLWQIKTVP